MVLPLTNFHGDGKSTLPRSHHFSVSRRRHTSSLSTQTLCYKTVMKKLPDKVIRRIGRCIYCDRIDSLSDEHIIPRGLNGRFVLAAASCGDCRDITSAFETRVLRESLIGPRLKMGFPSRHKKKQPTEMRLGIRAGEREEWQDVHISEYPNVIILPMYPAPSFPAGKTDRSGILVIGAAQAQLSNAGARLADAGKTGELLVATQFRGLDFERMIAKIGLGFAVAWTGLDAFTKIFVRDLILGKKDDAGVWVGCPAQEKLLVTKDLHSAGAILTDRLEVITHLKLFACFRNGPEYQVFVGQISPEAAMLL
jgi:hypothetical protein